MAKKIILISSFPVCIILAVLAVVFVGIGRGQPAAGPDSIGVEQIDADEAVDTLISDYNNNGNPASTLVNTASDYAWNRKYDGAERLYRAVSDKQQNDAWGVKARLGLARLEILNLIEEKEYEDVNQRIDSMIAEFKDEPDVAVALFHIGQELFWQRQFGEAREVFDRDVEMFPDGPAAKEMQLWSAKARICAIIYSRRATDAEVVAEIDKMINDFNDDPGLAGAVYWISKEYEWTKGTSLNRTGWLNAPNSVYQQIMQKFSGTPYGQQAELDQKRLNHRMKIFNLMKEADPFDSFDAAQDKSAQGGQNAVDAAIEEMVVDLSGRPEVAGELYWIACGYEEKDNGPQAKRTYERIVQDYPDTTEADRAVLDVRRRVITDLINAGDANGAEVLMDEFVADFNGHPYAGACLGRVAIGYYKKGYELKFEERQYEKAREHFEKAGDVYHQIIMNNLEKGKDAGYLYYYAAATYQQLGQWEKAIENFQKVVDDYPNFEYVCGAQAGVGWCYEAMVKEGRIPKEQANPIIEQAYTKVLTNYPDCYVANYVAYQLAETSLEKGDKKAAVQYYRLFLELAKPGNIRIAEAESNLNELERFDTGLTIPSKVEGLTVEGGTNQ
jgi:tetratricopeptide (TPR) repeat protein